MSTPTTVPPLPLCTLVPRPCVLHVLMFFSFVFLFFSLENLQDWHVNIAMLAIQLK